MTTTTPPTQPAEQAPPESRLLPGLLALALGALTACAGVSWLLLTAFMAPAGPGAPLARAARAVVTEAPVREGKIVVMIHGGSAVVPAGLRFDRERAVLLALESERLRRQAVAALQGAEGGDARTTSLEAAAAWAFARERIKGFLKVTDRHAYLLLYALGWPWIAEPPADSRDALPTDHFPRRPFSLAGLPTDDINQFLSVAVNAPAWPAAREKLQSEHGLAAGQAFAVRALLCRLAVRAAFESNGGYGRAAESLGKYCDLAPAQAEAALAMAGAMKLARAGKDALPALVAHAADHPRIIQPVLEAVKGDPITGSTTPEGPPEANDGG